jgi:iron complex transport system substrate-binding protein
MRSEAGRLPRRPSVFFEEWYDPIISGIRWVGELVEIAGGRDLFPELRECQDARRRIVDPDEVARRDPELIIGSWCGRKLQPGLIRARPGWDRVRAVREDRIVEVKSTIILQPGPAALTDGVRALHAAIRHVAVAG